MIRISVAISENRSLPGHVLQLSIWQEQGCPAAVGAASAPAALPNTTPVPSDSFSRFEGPSGSFYPCLCSWVCIVGLKTQYMSLKFTF